MLKVDFRPCFDPGPQALGALPIFLNVVSRARNSCGLAPAKTFLISARFPKDRRDHLLPLTERHETRTLRSSGLSTRLTKPLSTRRSTAVLTAGCKVHLCPIVFTGKGPLFTGASSIRKSVSSIPCLFKTQCRYFAAAWKVSHQYQTSHCCGVLARTFQARNTCMQVLKRQDRRIPDFRILEALLNKGPLPVNTIGAKGVPYTRARSVRR